MENDNLSSVVIPINNTGRAGRFPDILDAISQIQQFYVIESTGEIPEDFLTIRGTLNFFNVGFGAGFLESLLFMLLSIIILPISNNVYILNFFKRYITLFELKIFLYFLDFLPIIISAGLCCFLSKYYIGRITKKAINSLLAGRLFSMTIKGMIYFVVFIFLSKLITVKRAVYIASLPIFHKYYYSIYYMLLGLKVSLIRTAFITLVVFFIAIIIPFIFIWGVSWYRKIKLIVASKRLAS